jgi:DHA2 family multidrug resistance protein
VPLSQSTLLDVYPREKHGAAMALWGMGVMIGPILGPPLGGWLTDAYSWHWVFLINVPIGALALFGVAASLPTDDTRASRFDWRGFAFLAIGIGALQLMLDRGELKDWFGATEIQIEAGLAFLGFYLYGVHWYTSKRSFLDLGLFRDRNFLASNIFIFVLGVVLFATMALLPPFLQNLMNYPVVTTGMLLAPRGIGTLIAMIIVGRLGTRIDARYVMAIGLSLTAASLWWMTNFYLQMDTNEIVWSGLLQGIGTGCVFAPLSTIAFSTLAPHLRNEGTAFFSLMRNLGSSIGISAVTTLLVRNTQIMHSRLAEHVTPFGDGLTALQPGTPAVDQLAGLNAAVTQQAAMIAYNNDFKLMLILTVIAIPLVALLRAPRSAAPAAQHAIAE